MRTVICLSLLIASTLAVHVLLFDAVGNSYPVLNTLKKLGVSGYENTERVPEILEEAVKEINKAAKTAPVKGNKTPIVLPNS
jgi:hypothetical protein